MSDQEEQHASTEKATVTLPGIVEKIIRPIIPSEPEKAQIAVEGADHLYREIRVDNRLKDADGKEVSLKPGAEVEVTIEADPSVTHPTDNSKTTETEGHHRKLNRQN
jgi:hypothetical protein